MRTVSVLQDEKVPATDVVKAVQQCDCASCHRNGYVKCVRSSLFFGVTLWGCRLRRPGTSRPTCLDGPSAEDPHCPLPAFTVCPCSAAQSCPTLCDPMDCSPPGSSVHGVLWNTGVSCHFLLWGIFPTQGLNLCLLHCRRVLYH